MTTIRDLLDLADEWRARGIDVLDLPLVLVIDGDGVEMDVECEVHVDGVYPTGGYRWVVLDSPMFTALLVGDAVNAQQNASQGVLT